MLVKKEKKVVLTPFSDFVRNAKSREKKRIYAKVLEEAINKQNEIIAKVAN